MDETIFHKIRIETPFAAEDTRVYLDDVKVKGLVNVETEHLVGELPKVTLTLRSHRVENCITSDEPLKLQVVKSTQKPAPASIIHSRQTKEQAEVTRISGEYNALLRSHGDSLTLVTMQNEFEVAKKRRDGAS